MTDWDLPSLVVGIGLGVLMSMAWAMIVLGVERQ